ncbi:MAG TPA: U32 family peptidase [Methanoregulaceae archaeon]|nr:U32 family peptidase [Methanoregulaceae archaeon]
MMRRVPELLAPAGTPEALEAACTAGADAVYLGASRFSARATAGFDEKALVAAIDFAHSRDVRVYVALNTLIAEEELPSVADELVTVYSAGADALLVQDPGVASLARELVPALPLHASTQMTIHSSDGARAAMDMGCSRVVLARELSLPEIEAIAAEVPGIELEVFAHGALCYGWSGQCLFSSAIGGRSGNRGRCAQPCRKPYRLLVGKSDRWGRITSPRVVPLADRYLLSPRDLWTYPEIERLVRAPIATLKIEGRLRPPGYVSTVVGAYRRALDLAAGGAFVPDPSTIEALALAYNRGFTLGRLFGETGDTLMGRDRPGPRGVRVGTVVNTDGAGRIRVRLEGTVQLRTGDGLVVAPRGRPEGDIGAVLKQSPGGSLFDLSLGTRVPRGTPVYLTGRAGTRPPGEGHLVEIALSLEIDGAGRPTFEGTIRRRRGQAVRFAGSGEPFSPARSRPLDAETLEAHLRRTGGTPYRFGPIGIVIRGEHFAPAAMLNGLRRQVLAAAADALIRSGRPGPDALRAVTGHHAELRLLATEMAADRPTHPPRLRLIVDSVEAAREASKHRADEVCLEVVGSPASSCTCSAMGRAEVLEMLEDGADACGTIPFLWKWPRITRQAFLDQVRSPLSETTIAGVLVEGLGAAEAARRAMPGIPIHGGQGINLWNSRAAHQLAPRFASFTLSPELSEAEIRSAIGACRALGIHVPFSLQVQGSLEVLISEDCVLSLAGCPAPAGSRYVLEDGTHRRFPVLLDPGGRTRILNALETCLVDQLPAITRAGVEILTLDARRRTADYTGEITKIYRHAIGALSLPGPERSVRLGLLKQQIVRIAAGGITAGPFVSGRREE